MRSWVGFAMARARASLGLLLTLLALVGVTTAIIAGTVGYTQAAATTAARGALTQGEPTEAGVQVQTRLAEDPVRQDELARDVIKEAFAPAPVSITRLSVTEPRPVQHEGAALEGRVVLVGGPDLTRETDEVTERVERVERVEVTERVEVVEGEWPQSAPAGDRPAPGALHVGAARAWDVGVGDVLVVDDRAVEVVATWQPADAQDPFWFGDELVRTGQVEADHGPLVVAEELVRGVGAPFVRWTVRPDAGQVGPDDLAVLADGAANLRDTLRETEGLTVRGVTIEGDLAPTAETAADNQATARALGLIPLSVLVLVTGLAVVQLARLLSGTREPQVQLLVARGASRGQVLLSGLAESLLVALGGSVLGAALAWGVMLLVPGGEGVAATVATAAAATLLGLVLVLAAVAVLQAIRLTGGQAVADRSGRVRAATTAATVVLVLGAAGLAWWQLDRAGSPLTTGPDGEPGTDLVAGAAPALLLAAVAMVALALLGPVSRLVELTTRPGRGATAHLAAAQVSRRLTVYAVPVVLTVLAVGAATLASLYAGTSAQLRDDFVRVEEGAPLRADLARPPATVEPGTVPGPPPDLTVLPEVGAAAYVWLDDSARVGDVSVPATVADTTALRGVAHPLGGTDASLVPDGLDRPRSADGSGTAAGSGVIPVPPGATILEAHLEVDRRITPWGQLHLESMLESNRTYLAALEEAAADAEGPGDPYRGQPPPTLNAEEMTRMELHAEAAALAEPDSAHVRLLLRDTATGLASEVRSEPLAVPGMELTFDEETLGSIAVTDASTSGTLTFALPPDADLVVESIVLAPPGPRPDQWSMMTVQHSRVRLTLDLQADGRPLLGDPTAEGPGWSSSTAMSPEQAEPYLAAHQEAAQDPAYRQQVDTEGSGFSTYTESNEPFDPLVADTSGHTWTLSGRVSAGQDGTETVLLAPGLRYTGPDPEAGWRQEEPLEQPASARVPVALTPGAASAANLGVGDTFELSLTGARSPAVVDAIVPAVPGRTSPEAVLVDSRSLGAVLARGQSTLPWPDQVWATPTGSVDDAVAALREQPGLLAVTGPGTGTVVDATSATRLVFWVASGGAVLLALTGVAAVAATMLSARRPEVAVLRALGMPPRAQAGSRALELGGVVALAVAFGLGAGWLVSSTIVPDLARATAVPGDRPVQLPTRLGLEVAPWATLLVVGLLAVTGLVLALARRVRAQALDRTYREEIR